MNHSEENSRRRWREGERKGRESGLGGEEEEEEKEKEKER